MPRKTIKQRQVDKRSTEQDINPTDTDDSKNRVRSVIDNLTGKESPDDIMVELLDVLEETKSQPVAGKYYIFVYNPKTPNIRYDSNPFVAVTDVFQWGFRGLNFHWSKSSQGMRQYTWNEVPGGIYEVYASEVKDLQALPFANFRINS